MTAASTFDLNGGAGADTFDVDAALTGAVDGQAGGDTLQGGLVDAVTLASSDATGFDGAEADISGRGLFDAPSRPLPPGSRAQALRR